MATISVAIAVRDEVEENRKKQGDIIAIKEGGWQWGTGEVLNHLILELDLPEGFTIDNASDFVLKYFAGGLLEKEVFVAESLALSSVAVVAKRRFCVDWTTLKTVVANLGVTVDWKKIEDVKIAYQPFSDQKAAKGGTPLKLNLIGVTYDKYQTKLVDATDVTAFKAK